ncbi:MAG: hypothetical protein WB579_24370 [Bryobacteraceae bacterium]
MLKLLSSGLVVFAGVACAPSPVSTLQFIQVPEARQDARLGAVRGFFEKGGCPAREYAQAFLDAADGYRLDWRLLPSISFVESTGGKAAPNNNIFGWDNGRSSFSSPTAAIWGVAYQLGQSKLYRDRNLNQVLALYNPDPGYAAKVKSVMRQIAILE